MIYFNFALNCWALTLRMVSETCLLKAVLMNFKATIEEWMMTMFWCLFKLKSWV
jgi:hypothetical protein